MIIISGLARGALSLMRRVYRIIGRQTPSTGSLFTGQGAQLAPDRGLTPHRTGGFAASEYSTAKICRFD